MKKIKNKIAYLLLISFLVSIFGFSINNIFAEGNNFQKDILQYEKVINPLIKKQTKDSQKIEIELFLLQRNVLKKYTGYYDSFFNILDKNVKNTKDMLKEGNEGIYISSNILKIDTNSLSKQFYPNLGKDISIIDSKIDISGKFNNGKDLMFSNTNIEGSIKTLNNSNNVEIKTDFDTYENNGSFIFNIKKLYIKEDFNFNSKLMNILGITNTKYDSNIGILKKEINKLKKFYLFNKNKYIKINGKEYNTEYNKYISNISQMKSIYEQYKVEQKYKELKDLLREDKIFIVYKSKGRGGVKGDEHYILLNPSFVKSFYKITNINLLKDFNISSGTISKMERGNINMIKRLDSGLFTYKNILRDKDKNILDIKYLEFSKDNISKVLLKEKGNVFYLNKDTIKFVSNDKNLLIYSYLSKDEIKLNGKFIDGDKKTEIVLFSNSKYNNLYGKFNYKDDKININSNLFYELGEELKNNKFNIDGKIINNNKEGEIVFNIETEKIDKKIGLKYYFNNNLILPINIKLDGAIISKAGKKKVNIKTPKKIDKEYDNLNKFYEYYSNF